ncbi:hypothetical protein BDK51DRAFT_44394 [Blyttiomyces helicus]|uniref:Uncharacterized protein n=1 Tax=Blyttiomyces helicus TaxID=388810 RepID=A0A4P9WHW6_9FUNG|nr:hypothetical protein BDK51DRAFT_44394 [Blyttiomyces helicus]|eukprot:RKO92344.1 hypothetical protein BDK51DRAFT_44394 [Blyttiomyces helicus]
MYLPYSWCPSAAPQTQRIEPSPCRICPVHSNFQSSPSRPFDIATPSRCPTSPSPSLLNPCALVFTRGGLTPLADPLHHPQLFFQLADGWRVCTGRFILQGIEGLRVARALDGARPVNAPIRTAEGREEAEPAATPSQRWAGPPSSTVESTTPNVPAYAPHHYPRALSRYRPAGNGAGRLVDNRARAQGDKSEVGPARESSVGFAPPGPAATAPFAPPAQPTSLALTAEPASTGRPSPSQACLFASLAPSIHPLAPSPPPAFTTRLAASDPHALGRRPHPLSLSLPALGPTLAHRHLHFAHVAPPSVAPSPLSSPYPFPALALRLPIFTSTSSALDRCTSFALSLPSFLGRCLATPPFAEHAGRHRR